MGKIGKHENTCFEFLDHMKSSCDKIKNIFHNFWISLLWWNIKTRTKASRWSKFIDLHQHIYNFFSLNLCADLIWFTISCFLWLPDSFFELFILHPVCFASITNMKTFFQQLLIEAVRFSLSQNWLKRNFVCENREPVETFTNFIETVK